MNPSDNRVAIIRVAYSHLSNVLRLPHGMEIIGTRERSGRDLEVIVSGPALEPVPDDGRIPNMVMAYKLGDDRGHLIPIK